MARLLRRLIVVGLAGTLVLGLPFAASPGAGGSGQVEDFETGDFSRLPWRTSPVAPWFVQSDVQQAGTYAARAGRVEDKGWSWLQVQVEVTAASAIGFWYRVSSEPDYDFLRFLVDGIEVGRWSGETGWQAFFHLVTPGKRTFRWEYVKDSSESVGEDSAWIDSIVFPVMRIPSVAVPACTITIQLHQSIAEAIYRAPKGAVICLTEGTWKATRIWVNKDVVLRGAGPDKTFLELYEDYWGLEVGGSANVTVEGCKLTRVLVKDMARLTIRDCTLGYLQARDSSSATAVHSTIMNGAEFSASAKGTFTDCFVGAIDLSDSAVLTMTGCDVWTERTAIEVTNRAGLYATGCRIAAEGFGVYGSCCEPVVTLESTIITGGYGVVAGTASKMTLTNCTISECYASGVYVTGEAQVALEGCRIVRNGWYSSEAGVRIGDNDLSVRRSPRVSLSNCTLEHNARGNLVVAFGSGTVEVRNTTIQKAGVNPKTGAVETPPYCSYYAGIYLGDGSTQLTVVDTRIVDNAGWGIVAALAKCGCPSYWGDFTGKVVLKGTNAIEGNRQGQLCIP